MATRDARNEQVVNDGLTPVESATQRKDAGWFVEFSYVLFSLSLTLNRTFIIISLIALGAIAVAYWGAYTEHHKIALAATALVGLALLALMVATVCMLWAVVRGSYKWWGARRKSRGEELTRSEPR